MPSLILHTLFAQEVLDHLDTPALKAYPRLFINGAQGPDFLFYARPFTRPGSQKMSLPALGSKLHQSLINAFYKRAVEVIHQEKNLKQKEEMIAYMAGHLCHWACDSTFHPYIYSRTGNCKGRSSWKHHRFEALLDAAMLKVKTGKTIAQYHPARECLFADRADTDICAAVYTPVTGALFGQEVTAEQIHQAWKSFAASHNRFHDPDGRKFERLRLLEKPLGLTNLGSGFIIPANLEDNIDVANLLHTPWPHPATGERSRQSVFDLYEAAMDRAVQAVELFLGACQSLKRLPDFLDFIADRNYATGLNGPCVLRHFDIAEDL